MAVSVAWRVKVIHDSANIKQKASHPCRQCVKPCNEILILILYISEPLFMDFTWGAGGSTSELTLELSSETKARHDVDVNMHMTCTNQEATKVTHPSSGLSSLIMR